MKSFLNNISTVDTQPLHSASGMSRGLRKHVSGQTRRKGGASEPFSWTYRPQLGPTRSYKLLSFSPVVRCWGDPCILWGASLWAMTAAAEGGRGVGAARWANPSGRQSRFLLVCRGKCQISGWKCHVVLCAEHGDSLAWKMRARVDGTAVIESSVLVVCFSPRHQHRR